MKIYERMNPNVIKKQVGFDPSRNYNAAELEKESDMVFWCQHCGQQLLKYGDALNGMADYWTCSTKFCPNNLDFKMKMDLTGDFMNNKGNTNRQMAPFIVNHVA